MNEKKETSFVGVRLDSNLMEKLLREKERIEAELNIEVSLTLVIRKIINQLP
jgi:serine phosphatase RsbU (regulator of sigma subunit)